MNPDIAALLADAEFWELLGYAGAGLVFVGVIVESIGLVRFLLSIRNELPREKTIAIVGFAMLVLGFALEILAQVNANNKNELVIASLRSHEGDALKRAAELGLAIDNLHAFVDAKEKQAARQFDELKALIAADEQRNAEAIADLNRNRQALEDARNEATASVEYTKRLLADVKGESKRQAEGRRDIEKKLGDRTLTDEQVSAIANALAAFQGQEYAFVTFASRPREPLNLIPRIRAALKGAGWVDKVSLIHLTPGSQGVTVVARSNSDERTRAAASRLTSQLRASGIAARLSVEREGQRVKSPQEMNKKNEMEIRVGLKP